MVSATTWDILGIMLVVVTPLYAHAAYMLWKRFQTSQNTSDIEDHSDEITANSKAIQDIRMSLTEIEYDMELVQNDLQVIHDNVIDGNPCENEDCRWCEPDEEE